MSTTPPPLHPFLSVPVPSMASSFPPLRGGRDQSWIGGGWNWRQW